MKNGAQHVKRLFLVDSLGALLSAIMLGLVFTSFKDLIGLPVNTLYILAAIPVVFCIYSLSRYLKLPERWQPYLKAIAIANVSYCVLTASLVVIHFKRLTTLGIAYFLVEMLIVLFLARLEWKVASS